jgi:N-acetylmuramic acid 6-phosphate etherase
MDSDRDRLKKIYGQITGLVTEAHDSRFERMDRLGTRDILAVINSEDAGVASAVAAEIDHIAAAVDLISSNFKKGGRLFYFGAGTSGRLGIFDAAECPPTFGTDPKLIKGIIAGGPATVFLSAEGAEDDISVIFGEFEKNRIWHPDTVMAISASKRTPFAVEALKAARGKNCSTIFITCIPRKEVEIEADILICPVVGPEVVAGSTRMKAGLAQKMVLTMISTAVMIKMGKLYRNLMVDLQDRSEKLSARSIGIVMTALDCGFDEARETLVKGRGSVKTAIAMRKMKVGFEEARRILDESDGLLYKALGEE